MSDVKKKLYSIEKSALISVLGVVFLFSFSVGIVLFAPRHIDPTWTQPTSPYQVQVYEVVDPNLYISSASTNDSSLQYVHHLKRNFTLVGFHENEVLGIVAPPELEKYVTRLKEKKLKLTSRLLMLRPPEKNPSFDAIALAQNLRDQLQEAWMKEHPDWQEKGDRRDEIQVLELFDVTGDSAFALAPNEEHIENWIDENFVIIDETLHQPYHKNYGVVYVNNPQEYRLSAYQFGDQQGWRFDPRGKPIESIEQLKEHRLGFHSREELIKTGEQIYASEGCWYCHTDQTRTLVQDVVLNGAAAYPSPPSSANEYIYQRISFPGTKRNGPDISRTGVKRPSRDWHKGHFWAPQTASKGSIMPSFRHFFDEDPRGTSKNVVGIPNYRFEAIYQYLMTKGTRITPPNQAWWLGKDPVKTIEIIEGKRKIK